ncbi:MAG TPA: hypothetical protein VJ144_02215 [Candidatus Polarisedimenticolia bacterium]|nr:hypothetical protein [Candidatus Polarisedimenticolia bacterium]
MSGRAGARGEIRALTQDIYLQDLVLSIYSVYTGRLRDLEGRAIVEAYVRAEQDRRLRIVRHLEALGAAPAAPVGALFATAGRLYGRITSWLGTRVMLRIVLSASRRASRRACAALGQAAAGRPDLLFLVTVRARNEGDLLDALRQHLIDTRPPRA